MMLSSLSILIPAYHDEQSIGSVVRRARAVGRKYAKKLEIVVVNDASPDRLAAVLSSLQKTMKELRVLTHTVNQGYGKTIRELYYAAQYDWLFTVPGDGQFQPDELVKMLPYAARYDMIIGWRKKRHDNAKRKQQSAVYNAMLRLFFSLPLRDVNSIRLMRTAILKNIVLTSSSAFVDAELAIDALRYGYRLREVPIRHEQRKTAGASGGKLSVIMPTIIDFFRYALTQGQRSSCSMQADFPLLTGNTMKRYNNNRMTKPFFSIIIPYHNSKDTIGPLLASIYHSKKRPRVEVIIVDDASGIPLHIQDLNKVFVRSLAVTIIRFNKNKGPAIARNRGVKQANGEYVVFLDGDVRLFPDALYNLWKLYTDDVDIHAVTGVWSKEQKTTAFFPNFKALRDWSYWTNERENGHYYYLFSTRIASIRRTIFLRLGGFDESYAGPLIEDIAFTYKIATRYAVIFAPNVRVYHEFEPFWPIAKKYFLRAYYWTLLFEERRRFDPVATTWKEAVTGVSGAALAGCVVLSFLSLLFPLQLVQTVLWIGTAVLLFGHMYLVRKFLLFTYAEKGLRFAVQSFFMGIVLYCFITAGGVWSLVRPPRKKRTAVSRWSGNQRS